MEPKRHCPSAKLAACIALAWACLAPAGAARAQPAQTHAQARAQAASTQQQSIRTEEANRDAAVADEASAARPARAEQANPGGPAAGARTSPASTLTYGPVLTPRGRQGGDAVRKDPAEVHDETDTLARQAQPQQGTQRSAPIDPQLTDEQSRKAALQPADKMSEQQREELRRRAARRRQAWQGEGPMAPRPLRAGEAPPATAVVPIPPPQAAPQPTVPSASPIRACQGIVCSDAAGNTFNGGGNAGANSAGRACARTGNTVQCF